MAFLNEKERQTLTVVCDTLIPSLEPDTGDDAALFRTSASDLGIPALFETAFERATDPGKQRQFRLLLRLLENGLFNGLIAGHWSPISLMPFEAREEVLRKLATHRLEIARTAFLSFKRLALFLFYSIIPEDRPNPMWAAVGYQIPVRAEPQPKSIQPLGITAPTALEADVLVIGSGAGGGVIAGELAAAGFDVMVVEKGDYYAESDYDGSELSSFERMYEKYGALVNADTTISILAGSVLGGGTTVNWSASFRTPDYVLDEWRRVFGWEAATSGELQQSFDAVSMRMNVNTDESGANPNNSKLEQGCRALGYHMMVVPRNVKDCEECGFCNYGCSFGAKQGTLKTYLQDAVDAGARIVVRGHVDRILHHNGRAAGAAVTVTDSAGNQHAVTIKAKMVVVSAGAIHTPAVLSRSGLTNPHIGRHLRLHPTSVISGVFDDPIHPWLGPPLARCSFEFINLDGQGYGVWLENAPAHPGLNGSATAWTSARQHKRTIQQMGHTANVIILTRDRDGGHVTTNKQGQPVIHYRLSRYDARHLLFGMKEALKIHVAAGAKEVSTTHSTRPAYRPGKDGNLENFLRKIEQRGLKPNDFGLFSAHQMCTARLAADAGRGVVDPTGQTFEVKNLYVADGSVLPNAPGVNPMLTIMAVAHHIAQQIKAKKA